MDEHLAPVIWYAISMAPRCLCGSVPTRYVETLSRRQNGYDRRGKKEYKDIAFGQRRCCQCSLRDRDSRGYTCIRLEPWASLAVALGVESA